MTSTKTTTLTSVVCDRCGASPEPLVEYPKGWGHLKASTNGGSGSIPAPDPDDKSMLALGPFSPTADLCTACTTELFAWWHAPNPPSSPRT